MDAIDELGHRAARAALAEAEMNTDVEGGLARILADAEDGHDAVPMRRRWPVLVAVAVAATAVVTVLAIVWDEDSAPRMVPATPPDVTPEPIVTTTVTVTPRVTAD
jgi:hypothetical protein